MDKKLRVIDLGDEATHEELAGALDQVSAAANRLLNGPLTKRAILVLIKDLCPKDNPIGLSTIELVLEAAANLKKYVKKP